MKSYMEVIFQIIILLIVTILLGEDKEFIYDIITIMILFEVTIIGNKLGEK